MFPIGDGKSLSSLTLLADPFEERGQVMSDCRMQTPILRAHLETVPFIHVIKLHRHFYYRPVQSQKSFESLTRIPFAEQLIAKGIPSSLVMRF